MKPLKFSNDKWSESSNPKLHLNRLKSRFSPRFKTLSLHVAGSDPDLVKIQVKYQEIERDNKKEEDNETKIEGKEREGGRIINVLGQGVAAQFCAQDWLHN